MKILQITHAMYSFIAVSLSLPFCAFHPVHFPRPAISRIPGFAVQDPNSIVTCYKDSAKENSSNDLTKKVIELCNLSCIIWIDKRPCTLAAPQKKNLGSRGDVCTYVDIPKFCLLEKPIEGDLLLIGNF